MKYDLVLVIPTLNEEKNIYNISQRLKQINIKFCVIIVDDSNNNLTVRAVKKNFTNIKYFIIKNKKKSKFTMSSRYQAFNRGLKFACKNIKFDLLLDTDADVGSMIDYYKTALKIIKKSKIDFLINSKYHFKSNVVNRPFVRSSFSYLINIFLQLVFTFEIKDYTSLRYYSFNTCHFINKKFKSKYNSPIGNLELLIHLIKNNKKYQHIPLNYYENRIGNSSVNFNTIIKCSIDLFSLIINYKIK